MPTVPETMQAAILTERNRLEIQEVPTPAPGPMEVLLKVESCACCSTDVALMNKPMPGQPPYCDFI
ncbi:MAG: hypothetical protein PVG06_13705, partial [Desulfobacterales bacterium]